MRIREIIIENAYDELKDYVRNNTYITGGILDLIPSHPSKPCTVYRGVCFNSQEKYDRFMARLETGKIELDGASSWTKSEKVAEDFATLEKSYDPTQSVMAGMALMNKTGDFTYAYGGVVMATDIGTGQGLDVSAALGRSAEGEIILPAGTYLVTTHKIIVPYRRQYDTPEKVQALFDRILSGEDQDKIHFFNASVLPNLSPEQVAAYSDKVVADIPDDARFWHSAKWNSRDKTLDLNFKSEVIETAFFNSTPEVRMTIERGADEEARKFISSAMMLPDEAFMARRAGIFVEGSAYSPNWARISRPLRRRLATIYQSANDGARNLTTPDEIDDFTKGMKTLMTAMMVLR